MNDGKRVHPYVVTKSLECVLEFISMDNEGSDQLIVVVQASLHLHCLQWLNTSFYYISNFYHLLILYKVLTYSLVQCIILLKPVDENG